MRRKFRAFRTGNCARNRDKRRGLRTLTTACCALAVLAGTAANAVAENRDPTLLYRQDGLSVRWHFQAGVNLVAEQDLFWDLAETFAPTANFDPDTVWFESYAKPGISFDQATSNGGVFYGKASAVLSHTHGTDAYDTGNTGRITLEDAYLGYRIERPNGIRFDISGGRRPLKLGTGMLVENGGSSGCERGALKLGPRKAWERAAIARFGFAAATSTVFYLDPNETKANDSKNELAGIDLRLDSKTGGYAGLTYLNVLNSEAPYPKAAPGGIGLPDVIPNAREGLNALSFYARTNRFTGSLAGFFLTGDAAYEMRSTCGLGPPAPKLDIPSSSMRGVR